MAATCTSNNTKQTVTHLGRPADSPCRQRSPQSVPGVQSLLKLTCHCAADVHDMAVPLNLHQLLHHNAARLRHLRWQNKQHSRQQSAAVRCWTTVLQSTSQKQQAEHPIRWHAGLICIGGLAAGHAEILDAVAGSGPTRKLPHQQLKNTLHELIQSIV